MTTGLDVGQLACVPAIYKLTGMSNPTCGPGSWHDAVQILPGLVFHMKYC